MSDPEQRTEWAEHLKDEARAIAVQQESAGGTHQPVGGPLPFSQDDVNAAVRLAVRAERERCALLAASFAEPGSLAEVLPAADEAQRAAAASLALHIAGRLRTPPEVAG